VIDGSSNHFRIVGQGGTFNAPAGTSVVGLDGHTVQVEVSSGGYVTSIAEVHVPIAPVTHGWSTVRGQLVVTDATGRRFSFAGDTQSYIAPPAIVDVAPYAGKMVEIKLDETGQVTDFQMLPGSVLPAPASLNTYPNPYPISTTCSYRGEMFTAGAAVCQAGTQYRCDGSTWQSLGISCVSTEGMRVSLPSPRECAVGGATVASGSGVCRNGTTYRCDDGAWINIQTACR
jgi:hypothetical protein